MKRRKLLSYALIAGIVGVLMMTLETLSNDAHKKNHATKSSGPDYFARQITTKQFDKNGDQQSQLTSKSMQHFANDTTRLLEVTLILYRHGEAPIQITADEAYITDHSHKIRLQDHVRLHQKASNTNSEKTVLTDEMIYFPKQKLASTDKAVVYREPNTEVHSIGMQFDLKTQQIHLSSKARGHYASTDTNGVMHPIALSPVRLAKRSPTSR